MSSKMMASVLGGVATIPLKTKSGNWGNDTSSGTSISTNIVITVPKGNGGSIRCVVTVDEPTDLLEYRIDGGSWIEIAGEIDFVIENGQTLQFRATITNVFGLVTVLVYDQIASEVLKSFGSWVVNRTS